MSGEKQQVNKHEFYLGSKIAPHFLGAEISTEEDRLKHPLARLIPRHTFWEVLHQLKYNKILWGIATALMGASIEELTDRLRMPDIQQFSRSDQNKMWLLIAFSHPDLDYGQLLELAITQLGISEKELFENAAFWGNTHFFALLEKTYTGVTLASRLTDQQNYLFKSIFIHAPDIARDLIENNRIDDETFQVMLASENYLAFRLAIANGQMTTADLSIKYLTSEQKKNAFDSVVKYGPFFSMNACKNHWRVIQSLFKDSDVRGYAEDKYKPQRGVEIFWRATTRNSRLDANELVVSAIDDLGLSEDQLFINACISKHPDCFKAAVRYLEKKYPNISWETLSATKFFSDIGSFKYILKRAPLSNIKYLIEKIIGDEKFDLMLADEDYAVIREIAAETSSDTLKFLIDRLKPEHKGTLFSYIISDDAIAPSDQNHVDLMYDLLCTPGVFYFAEGKKNDKAQVWLDLFVNMVLEEPDNTNIDPKILVRCLIRHIERNPLLLEDSVHCLLKDPAVFYLAKQEKCEALEKQINSFIDKKLAKLHGRKIDASPIVGEAQEEKMEHVHLDATSEDEEDAGDNQYSAVYGTINKHETELLLYILMHLAERRPYPYAEIYLLLEIPSVFFAASEWMTTEERMQHIDPFVDNKLRELYGRQKEAEDQSNIHRFDGKDKEVRILLYCLKNLITRNAPEVLDHIRFLLKIPSVREKVRHSLTLGGPADELMKLAGKLKNYSAEIAILDVPIIRPGSNFHYADAPYYHDWARLRRKREGKESARGSTYSASSLLSFANTDIGRARSAFTPPQMQSSQNTASVAVQACGDSGSHQSLGVLTPAPQILRGTKDFRDPIDDFTNLEAAPDIGELKGLGNKGQDEWGLDFVRDTEEKGGLSPSCDFEGLTAARVGGDLLEEDCLSLCSDREDMEADFGEESNTSFINPGMMGGLYAETRKRGRDKEVESDDRNEKRGKTESTFSVRS
ncbi:MAG: putative ankyrin repeat protein [Gammaproteobacteria bacterium]|nr:putative ankyrin repeat protein [Gammaproteobacteria bacterium]